MKSNTWRILGIVLLVAVFGIRMYLRYERRQQADRKTQELWRDLQKIQLEQNEKMRESATQTFNDSMKSSLEKSMHSLDSIREQLEKNKAKFDSTFSNELSE